MDVSTNSPDLERAPGARSIGEEFVETTIIVTELQRCENAGFHFLTLHVANPGVLPTECFRRYVWRLVGLGVGTSRGTLGASWCHLEYRYWYLTCPLGVRFASNAPTSGFGAF